MVFSIEEDGLEKYHEVLNYYTSDTEHYIVYYFKTLEEAKIAEYILLNN